MSRRHWALVMAAAGVVAAGAFTAATPAAAGTRGGDDAARAAAAPADCATAYLQARAVAITAADPAAALAEWVATGSALARTEAAVAAGTALRGEAMSRTLESATCDVDVLGSRPADDGDTAVVSAHAITTLTWSAANGKTDVEASGIDHTITLARSGDSWVVTADAYLDDLKPACLEAAGAPRAQVRAAAAAIERTAKPLCPATALTPPRQPIPARRYSDIIPYDRPAAQDYADAHALSYNRTFVSFDADCANFASQCARAGDMPQASGAMASGWWYTKNGTSSPSNDEYSLSWINVTRQMGYWNTRRTDWQSSAGVLSRGDFIYYDWRGDGVWDHVAVVAGTNSSGQKIIDAHTTDRYHVFWKLGTSSTKYRFARVRAQWVV